VTDNILDYETLAALPKSTVTIRDVARAASVSRMTVSRALKKDSPISKEMQDRILQIMRELNYVPDQMAANLSTKRSGFWPFWCRR